MSRAIMTRVRTWGSALTAAIAITVLAGGLAAPAGAATVSTSKAVPSIAQQTNTHRAVNSRSALTNATRLNEVAQAWARQLAASGTLRHNPQYSSQIPSGWRSAGENIAYNCDASPVTRMMSQWKTSAGHNRNMLNSAFTHLGVGWATDARGCSWGVQVFAGYPSTVRLAAASSSLKTITVAPKPTIAGAAQVGRKLTARPGTWTSSVTLSYQWRRDGRNITGATRSTYMVTPADAGHLITLKVTGKRAGYATRAQYSHPVGPVRKGDIRVTGARVSTATSVGSVLRVSTPTVAPTTATRTIQWQRNGVPIRGARGSAYRLTRADIGTRVTAKVAFRASGYEPTFMWFHRYPRG